MVYLRIDENSVQAKLMQEYLKMMTYVEVIQKEDVPNKETLKAMKEAEKGGLKKYKDIKSLMVDLNN